jgi:hypothetical protein
MSKKTGRKKEEGGHKRHNVSFGKFVSEALSKVANKSQFLEKIAKPVLEQLDPGPPCETIQKIDCILNLEINNALENRDYGTVQALSNFAASMQDYRDVCQLPKPNLPVTPILPSTKKYEPKIRWVKLLQRSNLPYVNEETYQPTPEDKKLLRMIAKQIS